MIMIPYIKLTKNVICESCWCGGMLIIYVNKERQIYPMRQSLNAKDFKIVFAVDRCEGCQSTIRQNVFPEAATRAEMPNIMVNMIFAVDGIELRGKSLP